MHEAEKMKCEWIGPARILKTLLLYSTNVMITRTEWPGPADCLYLYRQSDSCADTIRLVL
jgi:hypothetical protein